MAPVGTGVLVARSVSDVLIGGLGALGVQVVGKGVPHPLELRHRLAPIRLPVPSRRGGGGPRSSVRRTFSVAMERSTSPYGFSYGAQGWHPYVEAVREYASGEVRRYEDSVLYEVHARFQPSNVHELIFPHRPQPVEPLARWPMDHRLYKHLWSLTPRRVRHILSAPRHYVLAYFGPWSLEEGRGHYRKLTELYASVAREGYHPRAHGALPVRGFFLADGDDHRFVVRHGSHRTSVLCALGHQTLPAALTERAWPVIRASALDHWTTPRGGVYPPGVPQRLFASLFRGTGRDQAAHLGLC